MAQLLLFPFSVFRTEFFQCASFSVLCVEVLLLSNSASSKISSLLAIVCDVGDILRVYLPSVCVCHLIFLLDPISWRLLIMMQHLVLTWQIYPYMIVTIILMISIEQLNDDTYPCETAAVHFIRNRQNPKDSPTFSSFAASSLPWSTIIRIKMSYCELLVDYIEFLQKIHWGSKYCCRFTYNQLSNKVCSGVENVSGDESIRYINHQTKWPKSTTHFENSVGELGVLLYLKMAISGHEKIFLWGATD